MKIEFTEERMHRVADDLLGTCRGLDDALQAEFGDDVTLEEVPLDMLQLLDDCVMRCDGCGWWVETSEISDDNLCEQCAGE